MKYKQSRSGFEHESPCPFSTTVTIIPRAPPQTVNDVCKSGLSSGDNQMENRGDLLEWVPRWDIGGILFHCRSFQHWDWVWVIFFCFWLLVLPENQKQNANSFRGGTVLAHPVNKQHELKAVGYPRGVMINGIRNRS